jgi:hypothetical protein
MLFTQVAPKHHTLPCMWLQDYNSTPHSPATVLKSAIIRRLCCMIVNVPLTYELNKVSGEIRMNKMHHLTRRIVSANCMYCTG